jgi:hypothetical protein
MATMFGFLFTCDTTPMMNIEDRPLMIVAGMTTKRQTVPFGKAFLPNEYRWVFDFSWDVAFPLMYGYNVIRKVQQITTDGDSQIYNPLGALSKDPKSPWFGVVHMLCAFHLVEHVFPNIKHTVQCIISPCHITGEAKNFHGEQPVEFLCLIIHTATRLFCSWYKIQVSHTGL